MNRGEEITLLMRLRAKDPAAVNELLDHYGSNIYCLARWILDAKEDAEDVLQETLAALLEKNNGLAEGVSLLHFTTAIAIDFCLKKLNETDEKDALFINACASDFLQHNPSIIIDSRPAKPEEKLVKQEMLETLKETIDGLSPTDRMIVLLKDREGFTMKKVSEMTALPLLQVRKRLHKSRLLLRSMLSDHLGAPNGKKDSLKGGEKSLTA